MQENEERKESLEEISPVRRKELTMKAMARQIVQEILNFGTTDALLREIIRQLALELEDRDTMLKIFDFLGNTEETGQKIYT
jgi:hypothetical protein